MAALGCGRQAIATADGLPVQRVVVYRNGIAYFERGGHVDEDEVRFRMKPSEVGDFLATLAVIERGGSSVRAAAFPLTTREDDESSNVGPPKGSAAVTAKEKNALKTVVLSLDGKAHDLQVGYVAESPVWKPSYRLVVRSQGEADLQAWGIVENLSGEDWKNVKLSLVAGAPLAFQSQLGTPVIPQRPTVTDEGEVIAAVPRAETSLAQVQDEPPAPAPPTMAAAAAPPASMPTAQSDASNAGFGKSNSSIGVRRAPARASAGEGSYGYSLSDSSSPPRSLRSLAAVVADGATTRYDLPQPVTIPDHTATMVMLLSRRVSGESLYLFAPDPGVPDSSSHPFRVARFANNVGGTLERGPIAVFETGSFLGQGVVDTLPMGATTTVPFALERGIAIDQDRKLDETGGRVAKIENGELTIERESATQTKYRVRNGRDEAAKFLVKHPRIAGTRLFAPPAGTEDNVGTGSALVPEKVGAHATAEWVVDERATLRSPADWFSAIADSAVKAYLADPKSDADIVKRLASAWIVREGVVKGTNERTKLQTESATLSRAAEETRRNLRAIEKNKTAEALRQKLTARLAETSGHLDDVNRRSVELDATLAELRVRFREATRDIRWLAPAAAAPPS